MRFKWLIAATWLAIIAGIGIAIRNADGPPTPTTVIATMTTAKPGTVFRPSDYLLWTEANSGQPLGDGDFVATSKRGGAILTFDDGRTLQLGPDTILIVTRSTGDNAGILTVNLVQGRVMAPKQAVKKSYAAKLQIEAGDRTVTFTPQAQTFSIAMQQNKLTINATPGAVALKERGKAVAKVLKENVTILGVKPTATKGLADLLPRVSLAAKPAPVLTAAPVVRTPKPKPKAMPVMTSAGQAKNVAIDTTPVAPEPAPEAVEPPPLEVPRVRLLPAQRSFWTTKDLATSLPSLKVAWTATLSNVKPDSKSVVALVCGGKIVGRTAAVGRRVALTALGDQLVSAKPDGKADGGERTLACQANVMTPGGAVAARSDSTKLALRSFSASKSGAVTVYLGTMRRNAAGAGNLWHTDNGAINRNEASAVIRLADAGLLPALTPWLSGASGFSIVTPESMTGEAYHYVRDGKIIASATMGSSRLESLKTMATDLKADMLFYGLAGDIMPSTTPAGRKSWLEARATAGQSIYILDGALFVEMDPKFLLKRIEAQSFVEGRSLKWFTKPVQVLR